MIYVNLKCSRDGTGLLMQVRGHAGFDAPGRDIVCAAASILAYTVAQVVLSAAENGDLERVPIVKQEPGEITVVCVPKQKARAQLKGTFRTAQVGYSLLCGRYPEFVGLSAMIS